MGYALPALDVSCSTFLDLDGEVGTGIRICADLRISGGPVLSTNISATPEHASLTLPPLERYANKIQLCYRCCFPESHEVHHVDPTVGVAISEGQARQTLHHGHLADDIMEDFPEDGPMLFGHDFVPSLKVDLCLCGERPSIASFELGKKRSSIPFSSYTFASGKIVKPGDKDVPLCGVHVKILESNGFTTNPF